MEELLARLVGQTLLGVTEARHWFEGVRGEGDDSVMHLWLHFADRPTVEVSSSASGEALALSFDEPYESYDMGRFGETRVEPVAPDGPLARYVGRRLSAAAIVDSEPQGLDTGVLLRFGQSDLAILQWSDDFLLAAGGLPDELLPVLRLNRWVAAPVRDAPPASPLKLAADRPRRRAHRPA